MAPHSKAGSGLHLLIVDDKVFVRSMMRRLLDGLGFTNIALAGDGNEALVLLRKPGARIDVIFCDLEMPNMDGIELVRHAAPLSPTPAFVFISASNEALLATTANVARARGINVLGAVRKPVAREEIKQIMDRLGATMPAAGTTPKTLDTGFDPTRADLEAGLAGGQFRLHYQPKHKPRDGHCDGFESLIRWQHPVHGLVPPGAFIGAAERLGLIKPLTDWVVTAALEQLARWNTAGLHTKCSVNLSAHMLTDLSLPDRLVAEASRVGVNPRQIILEITESGVFADFANTLDILARLHLKGFALSIDDFGTGYSSLEQLRQVPFSEMKIDRAFVHDCQHDKRARAMLEYSVSLARTLGMTIVAEGAEIADEVAVLEKLDINLVQGFFYARAMPADEAFAWATKVDRVKVKSSTQRESQSGI